MHSQNHVTQVIGKCNLQNTLTNQILQRVWKDCRHFAGTERKPLNFCQHYDTSYDRPERKKKHHYNIHVLEYRNYWYLLQIIQI